VSQEYLGIILCATLPPAGRGGLSEPQYRYRGLPRGYGGLFQNEETKRDREKSFKKGAAKAGGTVPSVIPIFGLAWLFLGSHTRTALSGVLFLCYLAKSELLYLS
jgi:hypothetical protein